MTRLSACTAGFVVLMFGGAAMAQTGAALKSEIQHELGRPLAADTAGLEAQVQRLKALLQKTSGLAGGATAESVPAGGTPEAAPKAVTSPLPTIFGAGGTESRPAGSAASSPTAAAERQNPVARMRQLLNVNVEGGGDPTRPNLPNAKGLVYQPTIAVGGDQAGHKPADARAHMSVAAPKRQPTKNATGLIRTFPQGGRNSLYGGAGGGAGGGDPRFSGGSFGGGFGGAYGDR